MFFYVYGCKLLCVISLSIQHPVNDRYLPVSFPSVLLQCAGDAVLWPDLCSSDCLYHPGPTPRSRRRRSAFTRDIMAI